MKRYFLALVLIGITALSVCSTRADDTNAPAATNAVAAATNAVAAPAITNAPTTEQRLESIEAYFQNGD
ncbi:MAG TPA: hypothetical protein VK840_00525, partial [Candidatus Dormibacteraeota bacterium]|nr:hypothetical protein [Candidatus Dormibacteraeota bacterium]